MWPILILMFRNVFLYLLLILLIGGGACVTVDEQGNPIDETPRGHYWDIKKLPEGPFWSPEEKTIPFMVAGLPSEVPEEFVLEGVPEAGNQGKFAAGTPFAAGYLMMTMLERKAGSADYTCSPEFLYNSLNGGKNVGLEIIEVLQLLKEVGCPDRKTFSASDPFIKPGPEVIAAAHPHRIKGFARVDLSRPTHIMALLLEGRPIVVTLQVSQNFLNLESMQWIRPEGMPVGRQTVAMIGFDRKAETWIFQNSAGDDWGHNGQFSLNRDWFARLATQGYVAW